VYLGILLDSRDSDGGVVKLACSLLHSVHFVVDIPVENIPVFGLRSQNCRAMQVATMVLWLVRLAAIAVGIVARISEFVPVAMKRGQR
jgi:hypothetical protein